MNTRLFIKQVPPLAWLLMLTVLCGGLFINLLGSVTTELSSFWHISPKELGILIFVGTTGSAIGAFLGGDIVHRFQPRNLLYLYLIAMAISIVWMMFAPSFYSLSLGFFSYEIAVTALFTLVHTLIAHLNIGSETRARMLSLMDVGFSIGASLAPIWVMILLSIWQDWRIPYAAFLILIAVLIYAFHKPSMNTALQALGKVEYDEEIPDSHSYMELVRAPWAIWTWIAGILVGYVEWGHTYWFVAFANQEQAISLTSARWGLFAFTMGMAISRAWQALVHSHWSSERRMKVLSILGTLSFICVCFLSSQSTVLSIMLINLGAGIGIGIVFPLLLNHLIDLSPRDTAKCSALLIFAVLIGTQAAGLIVGFVSNAIDLFAGYITIAIAMCAFTLSMWRVFQAQSNKN